MRCMGSVAGAVPRSNSGRAKGCVLPLRTVSWDSLTGWVMSGDGGTSELCCAPDCCAPDSAQKMMAATMTLRNRVEADNDRAFIRLPPFTWDVATPIETR